MGSHGYGSMVDGKKLSAPELTDIGDRDVKWRSLWAELLNIAIHTQSSNLIKVCYWLQLN